MTLSTKAIRLADFKAEADGSFVATFATLGVIDKDYDVTLPGAFKDGQEVRIAQWGHNWGDLPAGKGTIHADDQRAWVEGQFFLETDAGTQTYLTVKALGALQEWSYGYRVEEYSFGTFENQSVRFLKKLDVIEVSPVMIGAGEDTRTDAIKSAGLPLPEHFATVRAAVEGLGERVKSLADLRAKEGRMLSAANMAKLREHHTALAGLAKELGDFLDAADAAPPKGETDPEYADAETAAALYAAFARTEARIAGVA